MKNADGPDGDRMMGNEVSEAARARADAMIGSTIKGRFHVEELVAMGGLGAVYRATRVVGGREVAIKVLHSEAEGLPELIERFEREAIAGKHILHRNVVAVYEIDQLDDGSWFLVEDFVRGRTLRDIMREGPVEPLRAAKIARQVAAGLVAAHDLGIVHRDIKPRNIMVCDGPDELVQIVDFGFAKVPVDDLTVLDGDARRSLTHAGVIFGTVAYLAPEAALGMRNVGAPADLYALGVTLYEMLAGKHPFTATDPVALFAQQRYEIPPPIAQRSPGIVVPPALDAVVHRLLDKDPDARYPSARALTVALDAAIQEMDPRPLARESRAHERFVRVAVAVAIGLGALAALAGVILAVVR